jgi:hypothetical protein
MKNMKFISLMLSIVFCFALTAFGQETTGSMEITVRDAAGAVVPNVSVTVESVGGSSTAGFRRTVTTDDEGFQRILQLPPGTYLVTAAATSGFAERRLENINVVLGKVTPVTIEVGVTGVGAVVDVSAGESPIDTTDTKIQTTSQRKTLNCFRKEPILPVS